MERPSPPMNTAIAQPSMAGEGLGTSGAPGAQGMPRRMELALLVIVGVLVLETLLYAYPALQPFPNIDSGVFLYTAWRILDGEVPYRDIWDHKPPAVFFIDALGLWIGGRSAWGVWALELLAVAGAVALAYALMRRVFGPLGAGLACVVWVARVPALAADGNFTEEYALPLQWLALCVFFDAERRGRYGWRGLAIGFMGAVAFLLRQNLVGVWLAIGLYLLLCAIAERRPGRVLRPLLLMFLGAVLGVLPVVAYLAYHKALPAFWDAAFVYNRAYSWMDLYGLLSSAGAGLKGLAGLSLTMLAGWLLGLYSVLGYRQSLATRSPVVAVAVLALPLEVLLAGVSGRRYWHYYLAWLPAAGLLTALFFWSLETRQLPLWRWRASRAKGSLLGPRLYAIAVALAFMAVILVPRSMAAMAGDARWQEQRKAFLAATAYVRETTAPHDTVLMWGAESGVNWAAGRRSPTRFVYQYPLYMPGYQRGELVREFLADIRARKPALIIDAASINLAVPPIDAEARKARLKENYQFLLLPEMDAVFDYITTHYQKERVLEGGWVAYRYLPEP